MGFPADENYSDLWGNTVDQNPVIGRELLQIRTTLIHGDFHKGSYCRSKFPNWWGIIADQNHITLICGDS